MDISWCTNTIVQAVYVHINDCIIYVTELYCHPIVLRIHKLSIKSLEGRNIAIETKGNPVEIEIATATATAATAATITTPEEPLSTNTTDQADSGIRKIRYPDMTLSPSDHLANLEIESSPNISSADTTYCSFAPEEHTSDTEEFFSPEPTTPVLLKLPGGSYPPRMQILDEFTLWMASMDGGCQTDDTCYRAKMIVDRIIEAVDLPNIMNADMICKYFTSRQMKHELTASSTDVYLRFYSSFTLFLHQRYKTLFPLDIYRDIEQRIQKYVPR